VRGDGRLGGSSRSWGAHGTPAAPLISTGIAPPAGPSTAAVSPCFPVGVWPLRPRSTAHAEAPSTGHGPAATPGPTGTALSPADTKQPGQGTKPQAALGKKLQRKGFIGGPRAGRGPPRAVNSSSCLCRRPWRELPPAPRPGRAWRRSCWCSRGRPWRR